MRGEVGRQVAPPLSLTGQMAVVLSVFAALCFVLLSFLDSGEGRVVYGAIAVGVWILCLALVVNRRRSSGGFVDLRLGSLVLLYGALAFGFATLGVTLTGVRRGVSPGSIPDALWVIFLAYSAFALGYLMGPTVRSHRPFEMLFTLGSAIGGTKLRSVGGLALVYLVGLGATLVLARVDGALGYAGAKLTTDAAGFGWYVQPLRILGELRNVALFALAWSVFRPCGRGRAWLAVAVVLDLILGFLGGMKEDVLVSVLMVLIGFMVGRRKLPVRWLVVTLLGFLFVVSPFVAFYRSLIRGASGSVSLGEAVDTASALFGDRAAWLGEADSVLTVLSRVRLIDSVAVIVEKTPSVFDYRPIYELLVAPFAGAIPRAVWPTKPVRLTGLDFYQQYFDGATYSSEAVTLPGSLFLFGGAGVVVAGMLLIGAGVNGLDQSSRLGSLSFHRIVLTLIVLPVLVKQELDIETLLASLPIYVATYLVAAFLVFTKVKDG